MTRIATFALAVLGATAGFAPAQYVIVQSPRVVTYAPQPLFFDSAPVMTYSSPVYAPPPAVSYSYYAAPAPTYTPSVSYYAAPATFYEPSVSYYAASPTMVYSAPTAYSVPGVVTQRSYVGLGIFRPRGVHTETYFTPVYPR